MMNKDANKNLYTLSLSIVAVVALVAIVSLVVLLTGGRSVAQYVAPSVEQAAPVNNVVGNARQMAVVGVRPISKTVYSGVLIRGGHENPFMFNILSKVFRIKYENHDYSVALSGGPNEYDGEWVLAGRVVDLSIDMSDRTVDFGFPRIPGREIASSYDTSGAGQLVMDGQVYPFYLDFNDRTLTIIYDGANHVVVLDSSYEGEWVYHGEAIDVEVDTSERVVTFSFPDQLPVHYVSVFHQG